MQNKLEELIEEVTAYAQRFSDLRYVGQIVFVIIVLLVSWSGIKSIQTNYILQKQIGELKQQNDLQQLVNENQQLENNYYNSNQYLELSARQNFPLAAPGEKEIVVPPSVAANYVTNLPDVPPANAVATKPQVEQSNIQAWINFFLHHSTS